MSLKYEFTLDLEHLEELPLETRKGRIIKPVCSYKSHAKVACAPRCADTLGVPERERERERDSRKRASWG